MKNIAVFKKNNNELDLIGRKVWALNNLGDDDRQEMIEVTIDKNNVESFLEYKPYEDEGITSLYYDKKKNKFFVY